MDNLVVGDKVSWTSQAGGVTKTKEGTILAVIPDGERPGPVVLNYLPTHRDRTGHGAPRKGASYLVEVCQDAGCKPMIYLPRTPQLRKLTPPSTL